MITPPEWNPEPVSNLPAPTGEHGAEASARSSGATAPDEEPLLLETERIPSRAAPHAPRVVAVRAAWAVALIADTIQWIVWPLFIAGAASPFDAIADVVVAGLLIRLVGWHWAFLPSFIVELVPGVDLVPTWTAALFLATRGRTGR
jgi:hypothetical protein